MDRVAAVKRFALALIVLGAYSLGGLYLVLAGGLDASRWFEGMGELSMMVASFYFAMRGVEKAYDRLARQLEERRAQ